MSTAHPPVFRDDIQGLRAVAVLLVVLFHAGLPLSGGFLGVDVFFVISGYVITGMLLREQQDLGRIRLWRFYLRRIFRLLPAIALLISVILSATALLLSPFGTQQRAAQTALAALLLHANQSLAVTNADYFAVGTKFNPFLHLWSLSLEEQFYLTYPVLAAALLVLRRPWLRIAVVAVAGTASLLWMLLVEPTQLPEAAAWLSGYYSPLDRAWQFLAGAAAALLPPPAAAARNTAGAAALLGLALLLSGLFVINEAAVPGPLLLLPTLGSALLLFGLPALPRLQQLLSLRLMTAIGDRSYSWYLWHWPLIVFAQLLWPAQPLAVPAAALLSFLPADLSFRFVEQPLRRAAAQPTLRPLSALAALTIGALLFAGVLVPNVAVPHWTAQLMRYQIPRAQLATLQPDVRPCTRTVNESEQLCRWNGDAAGPPIYLVGDSFANHYRFGVMQAAMTLDRPFVQSVLHSCPFVDYAIYTPQSERTRCTNYYLSTMGMLSAAEPGTVVISMSDWRWEADADGTLTDQAQARLQRIEPALRSTVEQLHAAGHRALLVLPSPQIPNESGWSIERCTLAMLLDDRCNVSYELTALLIRHQPGREAFQRVAAATGALTIELSNLICADGHCSILRGEQRIYLDRSHLSQAFAETLAPAFVEVLRSE